MGLLKLTTNNTEGIDYLDNRNGLYYNKYKYRARVYCPGITVTWFCKDPAEVQNRISKNSRWNNANQTVIANFITWKNNNNKKINPHTIRVEGNIASVFSNDLDFLKTLDNLGCIIDYTEVYDCVPEGVKYFTNPPKHQFRIYLKSKRVSEEFPSQLSDFIERYKGTETIISPSPALKSWLNASFTNQPSWMSWRNRYCSSHYFIDYNEESVITLFSLIFNNMISRRFKLEKQPSPV